MTARRRALLSVSDKAGIEQFGRALAEKGFEILSTGGTARALRAAGVDVTEVAEVTGHPEMMDGRVKTLHPAIHGPLLARLDVPADVEALEAHGYAPIDLVAVNLYPFRETVARPGVSVEEAMEQVDIGGPTMLRAAAKNHAHVWVVVTPDDYSRVLTALDGTASGEAALRRELARKVFRHVSAYDAAVADFLAEDGKEELLPEKLTPTFERISPLRYGENPDQAAAFYSSGGTRRAGIAGLEQHHGKALSYNNLLDLDGALLSLSPFAFSARAAVAIVKHTTPCGLAEGDTVEAAYRRALATDPVSAFGSVIATNRTVTEGAAEVLSDLFVECLVAPDVSEEAMKVLTRKKSLRILTYPPLEGEPPLAAEPFRDFAGSPGVSDDALVAARFLAAHGRDPHPLTFRGIYGGLLVQTAPEPPFVGVTGAGWKVATKREPTAAEWEDIAFGWAAVYGVKSNAILLARDGVTLGIGAGQMSRVDASRLAVRKAADAGLSLDGSVLASDAFFPFRDGVDAAAEAGARTIVQPGGSVRDDEVIAAADEHGIAMVFTGRRLFRH